MAQAEVHLEIDGNKKLADVELLLIQVELAIRSQIPMIGRVSSIPHSYPQSRQETTAARRFGIFDRRNAAGASA